MWCGCFSRLKPRYKRLVDEIFPAVPEDGLVKNNMGKLIFYAVSSPEKLDRIGEYLYEKASKDISRKRYKQSKIAMEATDQLLLSCRSQAISLFIESFLRMVQKLLESPDVSLQIFATESFVRFANIDEQTPSYHLRYDFFVCIFSSMCHNSDNNLEVQKKIRLAGIKGLQGVIRKTTSDDLVENIWNPIHMNKIIPSLLYNMQISREPDSKSVDSTESFDCSEPIENDPHALAEQCLRELVTHASFGHVKNVLQPLLLHLDLHNLWLLDSFAVQCFRTIMYSIQPQYLYIVIESLMVHLNQSIKSSLKMRTSMADVLHSIIGIIAGQSTGPTALEIVNSLLTHVRTSAIKPANTSDSDDESNYREILLNTLAQFAIHLPDYQKIEIMTFIMSKVTLYRPESPSDITQYITLKCLLRVTTSVSFAILPYSFLLSLLEASEAKDPRNRLLVQEILHSLLDKHNNAQQFSKPGYDVNTLNIMYQKCSDSEVNFILNNGKQIYTALFHNLEYGDNSTDNIDHVFTTLALICTEFTSQRMLPDFFHFLMSVQNMSVESANLSFDIKYEINLLVACLFALAAHVHSLRLLQEYVDELIANRKSDKAYLFTESRKIQQQQQQQKSESTSPTSAADNSPADVALPLPTAVLPRVLFETSVLSEVIEKEGISAASFSSSRFLYEKLNSAMFVRSYTKDSLTALEDSFNKSEPESRSSSPSIQRKFLQEDLTFEGIKRILTDNPDKLREKELNQCAEIFKNCKFLPFEELCSILTREDEDTLLGKVTEISDKIKADTTTPTSDNRISTAAIDSNFPACGMYPEVFVY